MPSPTSTIAPGPALDTDAAARLRAAIGRAARRMRTTPAVAAAGLTPTKLSVLLTVVRDGPIRVSALAEAEGLNPTMLSRAISTLVESELVQRTSDDRDRRAAWVKATSGGHALARRLRRERTDAINAALAALSEEHRALLGQAVPALEGLAEQLREQRP